MSQRDYWIQQIQQYAEGQLDAAEMAALSTALRQDSTLRREFLELLNLDSAIDDFVTTDDSPEAVLATDIAGLQTEADSIASLATADGSLPQPPADDALPSTAGREAEGEGNSPVLGFLGDVGRQGWGWVSEHTPLFSILALLLILGAAAGGWIVGSRRQTLAVAQVGTIAQIRNAQNCLWADGGKPNDLVPGNSVDLEGGLLELHFRSGADVVLQGPARLEFVSADSVRLLKGKLAAQVPPEARGFQILTPHGTVIDLGTAFGLAVEDNGDAKVVVFQGKVDAYSNCNAKRPLNLVKDQAARIDSTGVARNTEKPDVEAAGFVRAIVPPPVIVPRTLALDFRHPVAGSLQDRAGNGIGLTHRMAGTGVLLGKNDEHLWLNTKAGQLEVTTTESDLNALYQLDRGEYFGVRLADLGFTGPEDFQITATFLNTPDLRSFNQFGLYAGTGNRQNIRGGMIGYVEGENHATQFLVNHDGARDKQIQSVGVAQHGSDAVLTLRRTDGRYSLTSENLSTGESVTLTTTHPAFLDGIADMHVGVFGANTRTKEPQIVTIKELKVTVWTKVVGTGRPVRMAGMPSTKTTNN